MKPRIFLFGRRMEHLHAAWLMIVVLCSTAKVWGAGGDLPHFTVTDTPAETNFPADIAPEQGSLPTPGVSGIERTNQHDLAKEFQVQLDLARKQRRDKSAADAARTLVMLLKTNAP